MPLSNDLLSQFAKATASTKKVDSETTVYGTVVKYEDCYYVRLDGSDRLTPMDSVTMAQEGDRVSVRIKNHSAAITGNISSPAANVGKVEEIEGKTKVYIDELIAGTVSTDYLEANYASIVKLNAVEAKIGTLEADNVTINEKLTAKEADIEKLQADVADIKILDADYAKISDLDAINADINNLEANYGKINNLIFDSASGTTIQTEFANSVIAQLGDAQIKSAMIEEVSADKIAAGDIITNNVRVMSEDGSLLIADETIQISNETQVRVQIGKDTEGDYNIYIWDADGQLMFDATGITEHAVKRAIIRDDMVTDNANISASKLDINSLFTEINGSSNTIKSSKIYLDEENQTLDLSFKKMTSDVSDLGSSVTSQGTQISVIQGQIESKIWEQDISTAIDGISVGGRNYFVKSKAVGHRYTIYSNNTIYTTTRTSSWLNFFVFPVSEGEEWTLYRCSADSAEWGLALYSDADSIVMNTGTFVFYDPEQAPNVVNNFTIPSGVTLAAIIFGENYEFTSPEEIPNIMLEKGNKASDWSLAPEDVAGSITTISDKYNTVQNTVDGLSVTVGEHTTQIENKVWRADIDEAIDGIEIPDGLTNYFDKDNMRGVKYGTTSTVISISDNSSYPNAFAFPVSEGEKWTLYRDSIPSSTRARWGVAWFDVEPVYIDTSVRGAIDIFDETQAAYTINHLTAPEGKTWCLIILGASGIELKEEYIPNVTLLKGHQSCEWAAGIVSVNNKVADLEVTINGISTSVSEFETYVSENYSTTAAMQAAIDLSAEGIQGDIEKLESHTAVSIPNENGEQVSCTISEYINHNLQITAEELNSTISGEYTKVTETDSVRDDHNDLEVRVYAAETSIQQIKEAILTLAVDESGSTYEIQDGKGWTFNLTDMQDVIDTTSESLNSLLEEFGSIDKVVEELQRRISELGGVSEYVRVSTYTYFDEEGEEQTEPCIELGESDSEFKQRITNTRAMYLDGNVLKTYISKDGVTSEEVTITKTHTHTRLIMITDSGDDEYSTRINYRWAIRDNGNYGLSIDGWLG